MNEIALEAPVAETLRQLISQGPVDPSTALGILEELLEALAFDHWRGIIHGDIAPENILFTAHGQPILADRGSAQADGELTPGRAEIPAHNPAYAAPEQIRGNPADERTDIFALGVVAYEMLTGTHPFGASEGLSAGSVMYNMMREAPLETPGTTRAGLPRRIPAVLDRALAKDPNDRFADATYFLDALKEATAVAE
ncbi:MAG: serine/threonine-protein kinase, partial [bacterium]